MKRKSQYQQFKKGSSGLTTAQKLANLRLYGAGAKRANAAMSKRNLPGNLQGARYEVKTLDLPAQTVTINSTATVTPLNLIRAGSSFFNRIGRKICIKSVRINGQIKTTGTAVVTNEYDRILLVYDRQTNGALPSINDILQTTDQAGTNTTGAFSGFNMNNTDRFVILRDIRFAVPLGTTGALTNNVAGALDYTTNKSNIDMYVKTGNLETHYKADSSPAVVGDISTGGLFLVTLGSNAAGAEAYSLIFESRIRYKDI